MIQYNLAPKTSLEETYLHGLLPQRNNKNFFYSDTSCRSNLSTFNLSSENRRIINKTNQYKYQLIPLTEFSYTHQIQKTISNWIEELGWDFPTSSLKTIFTDHIFNYIYIWQDDQNHPVAYCLTYLDTNFCHIAYVFYDPLVGHSNLPIRLVLQFVVDCYQKGIKYAYLGRFSQDVGYYKRNMPGFEYYSDGLWQKYNK